MKQHEALRQLFGDGTPILTTQKYRDALAAVRKRDPSLVFEIKRSIEPLLDQAFHRRNLNWFETSLGTRSRLHLLPENPWVIADAIVVRKLLQLPDNHVMPSPTDQIWRNVLGGDDVADEEMHVLSVLSGGWLTAHALAFVNDQTDVEGLPDSYSDSAFRSAKSEVLVSDTSPVWLRKEAQKESNDAVPQAPLFVAAATLVRRHKLPSAMTIPLCAYILTLNPRFLKGGNAIEFEFRRSTGMSLYPGAFDIVVKGIDEHMTLAEWDSLFRTVVRPQQDRLRAQRGEGRTGRRAVPSIRLADSMAAYRSVVEKGISRNAAARIASEHPNAVKDLRTLERDLADTDRLLRPESTDLET